VKREYWETQVKIIELLEERCETIRYLKIDDNGMSIMTPLIDEDILPCLDKLCEEKNLCYNYKPHTLHTKKAKGGQHKYNRKFTPGVLWKFMVTP